MSRKIRVSEPSPEMQIKIQRARRAITSQKICAGAKSAELVTSPVQDAPNTALTVLPKYTGNRRQPTPEKRGRA